MRFISHRNLILAARRHPRSIGSVERWHDLIVEVECRSLAGLRKTFPSADQVGNTLIFNIAGNAYRLACCVDWIAQRLFFRVLLTHAEYDRTNLEALCP